MMKNLAKYLSKNYRFRRGEIFKDLLKPTEQDKILDLGAGDGSHIASIVSYRTNVYIADISPISLKFGKSQFGFKTILVPETGRLPYPDDFFDIVFCSSVIEHVTVQKEDIRRFRTSYEFSTAAYKRQRQFAAEIQRVGKRYFVQTPNKYFPIESHTWLPFVVVFIPRQWQIAIIDFFNKWWPKKTSPDWNLLTVQDMQDLFPEAEIIVEKTLGFTKSIMAIKK